jgi:hypothetical protein
MLNLLRQLPDIEGRDLVFDWDQEGEWYSVVRYGDLVVWREKTGWEVYGSFERIAKALRYKYGPRLKDLVPTQGSQYALFGDSTGANFVVKEARATLGSTAERRRYSLREIEVAIREGDTETVYGYWRRVVTPLGSRAAPASGYCTWRCDAAKPSSCGCCSTRVPG